MVVVVHMQRTYASTALAWGARRWSRVESYEIKAASSLGLLAKLANVVHIALLSPPATVACKTAVVLV